MRNCSHAGDERAQFSVRGFRFQLFRLMLLWFMDFGFVENSDSMCQWQMEGMKVKRNYANEEKAARERET